MKKLLTLVLSGILASQSLFTALALTEQNYDFACSNPLVSENFPLARDAAGEGMVLLENRNNTLPLASEAKVSLFGIGQIDYVAGGTGSGIINTKYKVNFLDGMLDAEKNGKLTVNSDMADKYTGLYTAWEKAVADAESAGTAKPSLDEYALTDDDVASARENSDTAIYFIRRIQGEGSDRKAVAGDYYISDIEAANLAKIDAAGFDNFIIVINAGTAVDTSFFKDYATADSLIMAWLPGVEGGLAFADIVTGDVNPSGKLTDTFLKSYDDYPSAQTFAEAQGYVNYTEDIYNGYRYFETFDPEYTKVNYEFGYGLSYTTFEMSADSITNDGENINVSVNVKNIGDMAGKEVVQVYFSAPQGLLGKPAKELAVYAKTALLAPGASEKVKLTFPIADMSSFDDLGKTGNKSAYVLEAGDYNIYIGNSVKNAGERGVKGTYTVSETIVTEQLTSLLTPNALEKRLMPKEDDNGNLVAEYERLSVTTDADGSYALDPNAAQTVIDAENYTNGTEGLEIPVLPVQDNLKYVKGMTEGQYISFDVSNENAAMFTASMSISNGSGAAVAPSFNIYVNDELVCDNISVASTGSGTTDGTFIFSETEFGLLIFEQGKSTIKIESANDGILDIDTLVLRPAKDIPTIRADKANTIEAENYDVAYNNPDDGNNMNIGTESAFGETLVCKMQGKGNYIEYRFLVEKAGTYEFLFNYAATGNQNTPYAIYVNGVDQKVSYTLAKTSPEGSTSADGNVFYNTCADAAEPFCITLPEGFVRLRLQTVGGSPNINKFTLTKTFELPQGFTLVNADEATTIEAENFSAKANGIWAGNVTVNGVTESVLNAIKGEGRYLEYKLYFTKGGKYGVVFNHASTAQGADHFNFFANGEQIEVDSYIFAKTTPEGVTSSDTDAYYHTYADSAPIVMEFPEGEVIFRIENADTNNKPNLNKYIFKPVADFETVVPTGYRVVSDTEETVIQAESFDSNHSNPEYTPAMNKKNLTEGASAGQTIMENIKVKSYMEYNLFFTYGGTYTITYNYAAQGAFTNPYELYIDGEKLAHEAYIFAKTSVPGSTWKDTYDFYFNFINSDPITYTFPQGSTTLRIYAENGTRDMPNLNYFTFNCIEADIPEITVPDSGEDEEEQEPTEPEIPADRLPDYTEAEEGADLIMYEDWYRGDATLDEFVSQMTNLELIRLAGGHPPVNGCSSSMGRMIKYHIPAVSTGDGGAGIRTGADAMTTWWPCSTMLACTWNLDLIHKVGNAVGTEGARLRWDTWLAPGMNIHRNPLCGRNFEYYSEDPLIAGNCAAEITVAAREKGMHTVPKHFAANNKENGRSISDSRLSERALREIYLKGFEILVKKADPRYIMTSYNLINGTEAAESYELQTSILRDEWGFDGITMTDWNNGNSRPAKEIKAGSNIRKPYGEINELVKDLYDGDITREDLKKNAKQILPVLADSMSFDRMMQIPNVDRNDEVYISALDYNRVNDDNFGVAKEDYTKSDGTFYAKGDYFEYHLWTPGLSYISGGAVGMNLIPKVTNANIDFEDDTIFLEYDINVLTAGNYDLELFVPNENKSVTIYLDGVNVGTAVSGSASRNEIVRRTSAVPMKLTAGIHTIKLNGNSVVERLCISPNYDAEVVNVDSKIFTGADSEWGLKYETMKGEMGDYTHIVPDPEDVVYNMRTDHWGLAADETVYKYMVFCYRTNYDGDVVAQALRSGQATGDNAKYTFKADKLDEWTTSVIELTGSGDDTMFRQMHFSVFGDGTKLTHAQAVEKGLYFDLYHFGFFKTREDAQNFCKQHAIKPVRGTVVFERESTLGYYDDVILGYTSYAEIELRDNDGNIVAKTGEHRKGLTEKDGKAALSYSFEVPDGEYTLVARKPGYAAKTVPVTVVDGKADIEEITLLAGDISDSYDNLYGDAVIDIDDFIRILHAFASDSDYRIKIFTDINEDGNVNVSDLAILKSNFGKK